MKQISGPELKDMIDQDEKIYLVEVSNPKEFEIFHLPKAINVPLDEFFDEHIITKIPDRKSKVVVYSINDQSKSNTKAAKKIEKLGYRSVFNYAEGKRGWAKKGFPVAA